MPIASALALAASPAAAQESVPSDPPAAGAAPDAGPGDTPNAEPGDEADRDAGAGPETGAEPAGDLERPKLLEDSPPRYPAAAWEEQIEADVVVLLTLDVEGRVTEAEVVTPAGHGFDEEALRAARKLRFTPARVGGVPTPVKIRYTFRFRVPEKATVAEQPGARCEAECPVDARKPGHIRMTVYERGKGRVLSNVEVYVLDLDRVFLTDEQGRVTIDAPPGAYAITIRPPSFYPFEATERIESGETIEVKYYVRRHRRARYTTIVWGTEGRAEVARTSLADDEIRSIPGTMGDPIRVALLLPGSSTSVSGLGYPIVRGALPGDNLYEIDGIPVPMLYHLIFGTAVIHPRFVDEITFQPGGYSAEHGRFPGGRIGATTTKVEDPMWVADLSLVETSLMRSQPLGDSSSLVVAARYGTLGYIVEGLASNVVFRYWDYQTRLAHRFGNGGKLTLTAIGVGDVAGESDEDTGEEDVLRVGFHKADLRYRQAFGDAWAQGGVQVGYEYFSPPEDDGDDSAPDATLPSVRPYLEAGASLGKHLELTGGADLLYQDFGLDIPEDDIFTISPDTGVTLGAYAAAEVELGDWVINPSARVDHYRYEADAGDARETSFDPRLAISYAITKQTKAKASVGKYSGPSRFSFVEPPIVFGPVPALEGPGLYRGLNRTIQVQAGVESRLPLDLELAVTGFYHDSFAPVDFSLIDKELLPQDDACDGGSSGSFTRPFDIDGRSYGAELMLRRRLGTGFFGWVSYALSRSERDIGGQVGTIPFDFDQTHVLNTVLSWEVGRNWTLGTVFHYNTGRPYTPLIPQRCGDEYGYYVGRRGAANSARLPNYWRVDFRVQKREVFETWYFDFYVDLFNATFQWETVGYDVNDSTGELEPQEVPLFVPMIGIRGQF